MTIIEKLMKVQGSLKAPKDQYNSFGKYKYRNAASIMEQLKPLLSDVKATVILDDDLLEVAGKTYIKSTAYFMDAETGEKICCSGWAQEPVDAKGMSEPQMSGSCESYVHKYVLGQMFLIDDSEDPDTEEFQNARSGKKTPAKKQADDTVTVNGKTYPRRYYEACMMEVQGEKLGTLFKNNREVFNRITTDIKDDAIQSACLAIVEYNAKKGTLKKEEA